MLAQLGMVDTTFTRSLYLHKAFDAAATAHQAGTARFGTDPFGSVLDVHCRAHDLDNLYVVDGSFMPSVGAVNPTLTIVANALRVGDHIAQRIGTQPTGTQPSGTQRIGTERAGTRTTP
jgi:choline dehydrogenase-like flavoprotein